MIQKIRTFSGEMKQRLGIAQAMWNAPDILVLDEPAAGLDFKERECGFQTLKKLVMPAPANSIQVSAFLGQQEKEYLESIRLSPHF